MSGFYINDSPYHSGDSDTDDSDLPYPLPLSRNDFLAPDFSPSTYLSTLHNRHQTLEDLRAELRARSQLLSKELLDLVNSNYQDFLGLGRSLKSGDEKVEEVRVGLLAFRKEMESVRARVLEREEEAKRALEERVEVRKRIALGRRLVDYETRLALLESTLMVESSGTEDEDDTDSEDEESDEDENEATYTVSVSKLRRNVEQYRLIQEVGKGVGEQHPFITAQVHRMAKVRNTLLLDLNTVLRQSRAARASGADQAMKIMRIYADMGEAAEAVKVLKSSRSA